MKLIKLSSDHYIIVDDSEIKEGDIFLHPDNVIERASRDLDGRGIYKIIASTNKLNSVIFLNLSEVKQLLGEVDVEKMADEYANHQLKGMVDKSSKFECVNDFINGYNQALEDNKGKVYTKEDMIQAYRKGEKVRYSNVGEAILEKEFIQSIQPPTSWDVEFVDGKLKLV